MPTRCSWRSASDPLVVVESGNSAELVLRNSHLQNGSGCAHLYPSSALITFSNVSFADCEDQAIWAQQTPLQFSDLTFGEGISWGMELTGVSGSINGVDATAFTGSGAIVSLNSLASGFVLSDLVGQGFPTGGVVGENNEDITLERIALEGAPGIDVDHTSGLFSDITLTGAGAGTAFISHHGRSSDSLVVEQLNISGYSVGVSLHSDPGEISAPLILRDARALFRVHLQPSTTPPAWNPVNSSEASMSPTPRLTRSTARLERYRSAIRANIQPTKRLHWMPVAEAYPFKQPSS